MDEDNQQPEDNKQPDVVLNNEIEDVSEEIDIENIQNFILTTDSVPTYTPRFFYQQFVIYKSGSTRRFYWYDTINNEWVYTTGSV